jgi:hypothetical protein
MEEDPFIALRYVDASTGYGFNPPEGWIKNSSLSVYDSLIVFEPPSGTIPLPQLSLLVGERIGLFNKTLEGVVKKWHKPNPVNNFVLISESNRTINGLNAFEYIYTETVKNKVTKNKIIGVEKNRKVLLFEYFSPPEVYEKYLPAIERSINSVVIK